MKALIGIALLAFAAIVMSQDIKAPVQCPPSDGKNVTLIPSPSNCGEYYACNRGVPVKMICPPGLHFNPNELVCDFPETANCAVGGTTSGFDLSE